MDIKQLKTFVTIAQLNSFTRAANQLGYAQSSITSQIQLLEQELEVRLFERFGRSISLTNEGKKFLVYANQLINLWENAKGAACAAEITKGTINIGVVESICAARLPRLLKEYNDAYPDVDIVLKIAPSRELQYLLRENQIDVAILLDEKLSAPELTVKYLREEPLSLLVSPEHPLAYKDNVYPEDLGDYPLLLTRHGCFFRNLFEKILMDNNFKSKITFDSNNIQTIKQLAALDFGITLLPRYTALEELDNNRLVELKWCGKSFDIWTQVICHKDKWISSPLKAFLEIIKETSF